MPSAALTPEGTASHIARALLAISSTATALPATSCTATLLTLTPLTPSDATRGTHRTKAAPKTTTLVATAVVATAAKPHPRRLQSLKVDHPASLAFGSCPGR